MSGQDWDGPGVMIGFGRCYIHGQIFEFDPATVVTVWIDPRTGRPPDVDENAQPVTPGAEAAGRAVQVPICDLCLARVNRDKAARGQEPIQLAADRAQFGEWPS